MDYMDLHAGRCTMHHACITMYAAGSIMHHAFCIIYYGCGWGRAQPPTLPSGRLAVTPTYPASPQRGSYCCAAEYGEEGGLGG